MIATRIRVLSITALLLALASCAGGPGAKSTPGSPPGPAGARVVVTRSGGFAGLNDTITVQPQGDWTRVDQAGGRRSGRLTDDDRIRLGTLTADPGLRAEANRPTAATTCADGFNYSLSVGSTRVGYVDCPGEKARPETAASIVDLLMKATS